jgi:hypothetical protein
MTDAPGTSRKRSLDDVTETLKGSGLDTPRSKKMINIKTLSLEAIFHPKFENESRDLQHIRRDMKNKVQKKEGCLEVSLKHSGNLLLWSGGQRYYSKNSTDNAFTYIGEVLLRQHMERAWWNSASSTSSKEIGAAYRECSEFVEENRLTLAFECVTSVLGHHGDLPNKDFLMLTAVADKAAQQFYSTVEVLELAQRFRLPHNDIWVYSSLTAVEKLFTLYDTTRETGLAGDTTAALDQSSTAHLSSMYPHVVFQGNILEGIVIRYVAYKLDEREQQEGQLRTLEMTANDILKQVPPDLPPCFDLVRAKSTDGNTSSKVLSVDIREVFHRCIASGGYNGLTDRLGETIFEMLSETDSTRRKVVKQPAKDWDVPRLVRELLEKRENNGSKIDNETARIAKLICNVDKQNAAVRYNVHRENDSRWLCTIHVLLDKAFMKYQKNMQPGDMHLYRGFSIEMGLDAPKSPCVDDAHPTEVAQPMSIDILEDDARLMLKMKFLPYMVRTFCCRNGLKVVKKFGPAAFADYTLKQLTHWGMSKEARAKWQPFFRAWGVYAHDCMNQVEREYTDKSLPPFDEAFYLNHLEHFAPLYESGKIKGVNDNDVKSTGYRAMVVVVSPRKESATDLSQYISKELGGVQLRDDINSLTDDDFLSMTAGNGLIVGAAITDGFSKLRKYVKEYSKEISIILYGCDAESIEGTLLPQTKRLVGMAKAWEKTRVGFVKHVNIQHVNIQSSLGTQDEMMEDVQPAPFQAGTDMAEIIVALKKASGAAPDLDRRKGLLVFFPCLPGCGKSALSGPKSQELLNKSLKALHESNGSLGLQRDLVVLVGDKTKKKYWPEVKSIRTKQPSSIFIADKNAPVTAWPTVGESAGNGIVVPVLPDEKALSTTRIEGALNSSGEMNEQLSHFYPFSLHYLAVCMARVMARPAKSHAGGLDCALPQACLVVTMFFTLYRNVSGDELMDRIRANVDKSGSFCVDKPVEVPFFGKDKLPDLPQDLVDALTTALQMQFGYALERKKMEAMLSKDAAVKEVEGMLRATLAKHKDLLLGLTADETTSRSAFVDQVTSLTKSVCENDTMSDAKANATASTAATCTKISIASIDISFQDIHGALKAIATEDVRVMEALNSMGAEVGNSVFSKDRGFEQKTHVTMAHSSRMSQREMRSKFEALLTQSVVVRVVGLLWSDRIAALAVELSSASETGDGIPKCCNTFVHVTLWRDGAKSMESNQLPSLVSEREAFEVTFRSPFEVKGAFSFWA